MNGKSFPSWNYISICADKMDRIKSIRCFRMG